MSDNNFNTQENQDNYDNQHVNESSQFENFADAYGKSTYSNSQAALDVDVKVQGVLSKTFLFMFMALLITSVSAYMTLSTGLLYSLIPNNTFTALLIVEVVVVLIANATIQRGNVVLSSALFILYSILNGITLSVIFFAFELGSIISMFILAAVIFGCMAVFGLITKKDLTNVGTIGIMGLMGIIVLGIFNIFIKSDSLSIGLAAIGLAVFIGLTAYDMQKIKNLARTNLETSETTLAIYGALILYLDFINIFLKLLRLFGKKR